MFVFALLAVAVVTGVFLVIRWYQRGDVMASYSEPERDEIKKVRVQAPRSDV